ncbi:MAG: hypothetical protein Pars2KO_04810 [Parasphingorhabdus sp.]
MKSYLNKTSGLALSVAIAAMLPSVAMAQSGEAADADENVIVVTARGIEENIQNVPLAITAFDSEALDRQSIQELDDVARFTPGFSFEDFSGGFAQPVIRGQAQTRVTALETNVSTFLDGIYIPRSWAVDLGTTNLERVEVVKGPQSARYGRNAFAGAINYLPKKAKITGEVSGELEGTVGIDDRYDIGGFLNFSVNDYFAIAGSLNYSTYDGSWENSHPFANLDIAGPSTRGNLGGWENTSASVSAVVQISDGIKVEASYNYFDVQNEARASRYIADSVGGILDPSVVSATNNGLVGITNCGSLRFGAFSPLICGELPGPGDTAIVDPRSFGSQAETGIFRASIEAEITDSLTFSYVFGNIDGEVNIGTSGEPDPINCGTLVGPAGGFAPLCNFQQTPVGDINYDSHEARLVFDNNGPIRAVIGGFYSDGVDNNQFSSINIAPITNPNNIDPFNGTPIPNFSFNPGPFNILLTNDQTTTKVTSIFGEAQWTSGDGATRIGLEGRYSETEITAVDNRRNLMRGDTFKFFTPRITAEHDFNDDVLVFASAARGAKAGGFNLTGSTPDRQTFDPEFNWTYELGVKSTLANGQLIFNGSVFYTDWSDIQVNAADEDPANPNNPNVPSITQNLGDASVFGVEFAAKFQATDNLSFDATFSHTEAEYSNSTVDSRFSRGSTGPFGTQPCDDIVCNTNGNIGGNEVERTPATQASAGIQWDGELGDDGTYFIRTDASWQSDFFADSANLGVIPSRFLVNAAAGGTSGPVSVRVWVRNLFDKKYLSNAFVVLLPFGNTYGEFFGERRSFGVTTKVKF